MARAKAGPLDAYRRKRDFSRTQEPAPGEAKAPGAQLAFVVQKHAARREHYDFRLQWGGVLKSWAVTRPPSLNPADKRLAVRTEDHPLDYATFEGTIPKGEYGGGTVMLWDRGVWEPLHDPDEGLAAGKLHFRLHGERMQGGWALVRMRPRPKERGEHWLLIKERDGWAKASSGRLTRERTSVKTGRTMRAIAKDAPPVDAAIADDPPGGEPAKRPAAGLPAFVKTQLATLVERVPEGEDWLHELKHDSYRCQLAMAGGMARCYSRSGED
jgi:bifunctional non-homologous end joining protein LigD